jgi:hypothetical protein
MDNLEYFCHDKAHFGEEVTRLVARDNDLGEDVSHLFQAGRSGIDAAYLLKGEQPRLTIIESKASDSAYFRYSDKQKLGGNRYIFNIIDSDDPRYVHYRDHLQDLKEENPGLQLYFIRIETDIEITDGRFVVDTLKVRDWNKEIG